MRSPYRVAVWGPGSMGSCAIREILRLPETELVSVRAYNPEKHGIDVGTMLGGEAVGVRVTTDVQELVAAKPEVVLHTPQYFPDSPCDDDVAALLEAGIDVISALPYQYPKARGEAVWKRLDEAAKRGGATLFGTGIFPGFVDQHLAAVMTGISNDIQSVRVDEFFNCEHLKGGNEILGLLGFGLTPDEIEKNTVPATIASDYLPLGMHFLADKLGTPIDRIDRTTHHESVDRDIELPGIITAKAGTVSTVSYRWTGYTKGKTMFVAQVHWYLNESLRPDGASGANSFSLQIEGRPSTRLSLEILGSVEKDLLMLPSNPTSGTYFANVISMIQAIPMVVDAAPGWLVAAMPQVHWKPDMRA